MKEDLCQVNSELDGIQCRTEDSALHPPVSRMLKKGTPVIINDADAPCARLIAVLTRYDDEAGTWFAKYLSTSTNMKVCATSLGLPTPISDFGLRIEIDEANGRYCCVPTGEPCRAVYRDGAPRKWQDFAPHGTWWKLRASAPRPIEEPSGDTEQPQDETPA